MASVFSPCPCGLNFFHNCLFHWYKIAPTISGITVEDLAVIYLFKKSHQISRSATSINGGANMLPGEELEHLKNSDLWSVHLIVPCFLQVFDDRILQISYFSLPGTVMVEAQRHTHLDNGICGQDLWQKSEELMKDFSQDQMKANPPQYFGGHRKKGVTDKERR